MERRERLREAQRKREGRCAFLEIIWGIGDRENENDQNGVMICLPATLHDFRLSPFGYLCKCTPLICIEYITKCWAQFDIRSKSIANYLC